MTYFKKKWILLLAIIPILAYFSWLNCYGINIPLFDDHAFKNFLLQWNATNSTLEKNQLLFAQHNEHRIAYTRFVIIVIYWLTGQLNYVYLMWVGNMALIGILVVYYKAISLAQPQSRYNLMFSIISLSAILFTLLHQENTFWGMASLQNFGVVFWALLCLYQVVKQRFIVAMFVGFVATFSSGNGFLVLAIAALIFLLQKKNLKFFLWVGFSVLLSIAYFFSYSKPPGNPAEASLGHGFLLVKGFLVLVGSAFDMSFQTSPDERLLVSAIAGGIVFILLIWLVFRELKHWLTTKKLSDWQLFWIGSMLFVLGTLGVTVVTRLGFGESLLLTSRYKIYSVVLVMLLVLAFTQQIKQSRNTLIIISFLSFVYAGYVYFQQNAEVVFHRNYLISSQFNGKGEPENKKVPYLKPHTILDNKWQTKPRSDSMIDTLYKVNQEWVVINQNFEMENDLNDAAFLLVTSSNGQFIFPTRQNRNLGKKNLLQTLNYFKKGFVGTFSENDVPNGTYSLSIVECKGGNTSVIFTGKTIEVQLKDRKKLLKNW